MAPVQLVLEAPELGEQAPPQRTACPCGALTLIVRIAGVPVVLDRGESLEPYPCSLCAQVEAKGHTRGACWRCGGTRVIGGDLPSRAVAIDEVGAARRFVGGLDSPAAGDAVHAVHRCVVVAVAMAA